MQSTNVRQSLYAELTNRITCYSHNGRTLSGHSRTANAAVANNPKAADRGRIVNVTAASLTRLLRRRLLLPRYPLHTPFTV